MPSSSCAEVSSVNAYKVNPFLRNVLREDAPVTDAQETLVANLRALMRENRETHGTQAKLAQRSGVCQSTVGRILSKKHHPTTEVLAGLADAFALQPWQLLAPSLQPTRVLSPFARDMAEMIDSRILAQGAREARESIRAEITYRFGPGSELRPVELQARAEPTQPHPCGSGTPGAKTPGRS